MRVIILTAAAIGLVLAVSVIRDLLGEYGLLHRRPRETQEGIFLARETFSRYLGALTGLIDEEEDRRA